VEDIVIDYLNQGFVIGTNEDLNIDFVFRVDSKFVLHNAIFLSELDEVFSLEREKLIEYVGKWAKLYFSGSDLTKYWVTKDPFLPLKGLFERYNMTHLTEYL